MAYQTGTTDGAADLLAKLETFASANGWTIDDSVGSNKFALSKNSIYVSFRYDATATTGDQYASIHQALGHTPGNDPGAHPDDSGSGYNATSSVAAALLSRERHVNIKRSTDELANTYYFFEQDASPAYIHCVIARTDRTHAHFGFGELEKFGTWTGGEYCYGQIEAPNGSQQGSLYLLDGSRSPTSSVYFGSLPTIHVESFPDQDPSSKWGTPKGALSGNDTTDSAGNPRMRIQGGYRGGPLMHSLGSIKRGRINGFVNLLPIQLWAYSEQVSPTPDRLRYMGEHPDVRGVILDGISPGEELTIGSETWVCFPSVEKTEVGGTRYMGVAYRKELS
jgi:hypothetical protein